MLESPLFTRSIIASRYRVVLVSCALLQANVKHALCWIVGDEEVGIPREDDNSITRERRVLNW